MTGNRYIDDYTEAIRSGKIVAAKRLKKAVLKYIPAKLNQKGVTIDHAQIEIAKEEIERRFDFVLMPWELYVLALVHCYKDNGRQVVFREFLIVMGRGNGKNGFISGLIWYLASEFYGVEKYDIDIIANSEEQATRSFNDVYEMMDADPEEYSKDKWYISKVMLKSKITGSYIRFNTSNSKTKDSKRTACLIADEIHEYENGRTIGTFVSGFGKKPFSRIFKITTNGYVRDGQLDSDLARADDVLSGQIKDLAMCPLIYECDTDAQCLDPKMWEMANPSIKHLPHLMEEVKASLIEMKYDSQVEMDFYTKRMNRPRLDRELAIATREELINASGEMPDLTGLSCVAGMDYAMLSDMASVGLLFRVGDKRYWIQHSWFCTGSADWNRVRRVPEFKNEWSDQVTIVDAPQISPDLLIGQLTEWQELYDIQGLALDHVRFELLKEPLGEIGFIPKKSTDDTDGNMWLVRPLGIVTVVPIIESWFRTQALSWGDVPLMRWAANNTKKVRMKSVGSSGNFKYDKIEPKSRKNDPFMALAHAAVIDGWLKESAPVGAIELPVFTW